MWELKATIDGKFLAEAKSINKASLVNMKDFLQKICRDGENFEIVIKEVQQGSC